MTAPGTSFSGPVLSGPRASQTPQGTLGSNQGFALLSQVVTLAQNGTTAVSQTMYVPKHSQLVEFILDNTAIWNSATSAVLSIGTAAADTSYLNYTTLTTVTAANARVLTPSITTTQLIAMQDVGTNEAVVVTVTPTGATSAGSTFVTMLYRQTLNWDTN